MKNSLILRVFDAKVQEYELNKLVGNCALSSFVDLISIADLEANPRESKKGEVTNDIEESLSNDPEIFHFLTKGVLIGACKVISLDRDRFRLTFEDPQLEGILDGGHNTFAIGRYILQQALENSQDTLRKIRRWEDLKDAWAANGDAVSSIRSSLKEIRVPVEIIYPGAGGEEVFREKIIQINAARNNNVQLTEETKAHRKGLYDQIKDSLDPAIRDRVEWKANDGGTIKSRDIVALSLIPLSAIPNLPTSQAAENPSMIFAQKGMCVDVFNKFDDPDNPNWGNYLETVKGDIVRFKDPLIKSAFEMMAVIPKLYDLIYELFPGSYNSVSPRFGGIGGVRRYETLEKYSESKEARLKFLKAPAKTKFYQKEVLYDYPDGFIYPLVVGLTALMEIKDGRLAWKTEPCRFINANLNKVMQTYVGFIQGQTYDPAKVGKSRAAYSTVTNLYSNAINEELIARLRAEGKI